MDVLAVVDSHGLAAQVSDVLEAFADRVVLVTDLEAARAHLRHQSVDVVVAEFDLDGQRATDLIDGSSAAPPFPLVVLASQGGQGEAVEALKSGALDYLAVDDAALLALPHVLRGARREHALRERARMAEDRLLHANRLIGAGRLAAVAAHEVGTPLNVARMQAQLLMSEPDASPAVIEGCEAIIAQIDVVAGHMHSMLDLARVGAHGRAPLALGEAVQSAVSMLRPLAARAGIVIALEGDDRLVLANRSQVQQVVFNLVINAIHAIESDGTIGVRLLEEEREGERFGVVSVTDSGPGVAAEMSDHLFDAFYTTKPAGRGTGLGLSVCWDIAQAHQGWIELRDDGATQFAFGVPSA